MSQSDLGVILGKSFCGDQSCCVSGYCALAPVHCPLLHLHVNCIFWSANGILGCRLDSLAVCMHCLRLMKLLGLQVCSSSEQQCIKQAWSKAVHHTGCESVADQRVHRDDGCGRVSQMATAAGSLGSRLDTGNQSVHVSQRCNSVNDQEEGSSDEEEQQEPSWPGAAKHQEQQVVERMQHMSTSVAAKAPHAR